MSKNAAKKPTKAKRQERCVVLVDDESAYLDLLEQFFRQQLACPVLSFDNPRKALKGIRNRNVGLIVTDFNMPDLNGLEFIVEVQRIFPAVPVLMITAYLTSFTEEELRRVPSLKAVVRKPFRWPVLAEHIAKHWPSTTSSPFP